MTTTNLIIFDCDGVLIDSEIVVCRLVRRGAYAAGLCGEHGAGHPPFCRSARARDGRRDRSRLGPADPGRVLREREGAHRKPLTRASCAPFRASPRLWTACGFRTAWPPAATRKSCVWDFALSVCSTVSSADLISAYVVAHGKPAPDVFIYAAGWMRTPVADCLVIEDSTHGVHAARSAGMRVFGFPGGQHCGPGHRERLIDAGAELVFDDFRRPRRIDPGRSLKKRRVPPSRILYP